MTAAAWTPWSGGECPVDGRDRVEVAFKCGMPTTIGSAAQFDWSHHNDNDDIAAYRVVEARRNLTLDECRDMASRADLNIGFQRRSMDEMTNALFAIAGPRVMQVGL